MNIVIASSNLGKIEEIKSILDWPVTFLSLKEIGLDKLVIDENGSSFEENAIIKAKTVLKHVDGYVLADDSGLCVDALNGKPGIHSARYGGEKTPFSIKRKMLLEELLGYPKELRTANFKCSVVLASKNELFTSHGIVEGFITVNEIGDKGFGYDSIFYYPSLEKTFGEIDETLKNSISHRYRALKSLEAKIRDKGII